MRLCFWPAGLILIVAAVAGPAHADKIKHPTAVFSGLDKITGRIVMFEAAIDETAQFGTLQITPRVCYSRPPTEAPLTDVFAEVDEVQPDKSLKRIFGGWMFADSPGLHGIEHPVYDIWLVNCKGDGPLIKEAPEVADLGADSPDSDPGAAAKPASTAPGTPVAQPKKQRKPRVDAGALPPPLDIAPPNTWTGGRGGSGSRGQVDAAPLPPANIGQ